MIPISCLADKHIAIFGLGKSGIASAAALIAGGARVTACDDNGAALASAEAAAIPTATADQLDWPSIDLLVLSPGVPLTHPQPHHIVQAAMRHNVDIIGDTELFERERAARAPTVRLVAITGTNGKSTTTALCAHLLSELGEQVIVGGNIGDAILGLDDFSDGSIYVIEFSSYQIDLTPGLRPDVGILLNISPDHLDRHGDLANYAAVKERLVVAAGRVGLAVVGVDDDWSRAIADRVAGRGDNLCRISVKSRLDDGLVGENGRIFSYQNGAGYQVADVRPSVRLRGAHNLQNAAAALATARALGHPAAAIGEALNRFPGLAHRMEILGRRGSVLFVNDSKATNADSAAQALGAFSNIYWIAGGRAKSGGIEALSPYFSRVRHAFLIGESATSFANTLDGKVAFTISGDLEMAVVAANRLAAAEGAEPVVLLSPACASFDQYRNFEVRGDAFRAAVFALGDVEPE